MLGGRRRLFYVTPLIRCKQRHKMQTAPACRQPSGAIAHAAQQHRRIIPGARQPVAAGPDLGGRGSGSSAKGASGGAAPPAEKVNAPEGGAQRCADSARSALTATARPAVTASAATAMLGLHAWICLQSLGCCTLLSR